MAEYRGLMTTSRFVLPVVLAWIASTMFASGQLFWTATPQYITPVNRLTSNTEYSHWEVFYDPYNDVNYPDIAAPNGIKQTATAAGFTATGSSPANPLAFWHVDNPGFKQTLNNGQFIIGAGIAGSGNIYSFGGASAYELTDTTPYASGSVNLQWQTDGTPINLSTLRLVYDNGTSLVELAPTNLVTEYQAAASAFGFAPKERISAQWDLTGLNISSYKITFGSYGSSNSFQELVLDTAQTFVEVTPSARVWDGGGGNANWGTAANWAGDSMTSAGGNVTIGAGGVLTLDASRMVGDLKLTSASGLDINATGGAALTVNTGITLSPAGAATYNVNAPVTLGGFNMISNPTGTTLSFNQPLSSPAGVSTGIYKEGAGTMILAANNTFQGPLVVDGGLTVLRGSNALSGANIFAGVLRLEHAEAFSSSAPPTVGFGYNAPEGTKLQMNGHSITVAGLVTDSTGVGLPVVENGAATDATLTVNAGTGTYAGTLRDGGAGRLSLVNTGASSLTLAGRNSHTGSTSVTGGTLTIAADVNLGAAPDSPTAGHLVVSGGTLAASNTVSSFALDANRGLAVGGAGGAATVSVTGLHQVLSYGGVVSDNGTGAGGLVKGGSGTLQLTGANTYTGGTTVSFGFVQFQNSGNFGTGGISVAASAGLRWLPGSTADISSGRTVAVTGSGQAYLDTNGNNPTLGSAISGAGGVNKIGNGTLTLAGANTYTGATVATRGTLKLDFNAAPVSTNMVSASSALQLGGGTLAVQGRSSGSSSQSFASTAVNQGSSHLQVNGNGGSGTSVALGAITRAAGGSLNYTPAGNATLSTSTSTAVNGVLTSATDGVAYATVGGSHWAALSAGQVTALTAYETSTAPGDWAATENVAPAGDVTGVTTASISTLKLDNGADVAINSGQTLTLSTGGLLVSGSGASSLTGGTIRGSNGSAVATRELVVHQHNTANEFTLGSVIANNSGGTATAFTKTGEGVLVVSGANTYTGITRITGGVLSVATLGNGGAASTLGQSANGAANLVIDGGTLRYTGSGHSTDRLFTLGNNGATLDASGTGVVTFANTGTLGNVASSVPRMLTLTGSNTGANSLNAGINNTSGVVSLAKTGAGTWVLGGTAANQFSGGINIQEGTLRAGKAGALGTLNAVTFGAGAASSARLQLNGFAATVMGLDTDATTPGAPVVENASATHATLTVNTNGSSTYAGTLQDGAGGGTLALAKAGLGALTLSGSNSHTGGTVVNQGMLVAGSNSALGSGGATVNNGGTLEVPTGRTIANPVTVNSGGTLKLNGAISAAVSFEGGTLSGSGTLAQALTVGSGAGQLGTLAPGNSPGTQGFIGNQTWAGGGTYEWEINSLAGLAGGSTGWDLVSITGSLDITASTLSPFSLEILSLTSSNTSGLLAGFDPMQNYDWIFLSTTDGINGFSQDAFSIDTTGFSNSYSGGFEVFQSGNNLVLSYTSSVPEPGRAVLTLLGALCVAARRRRRA